MSYALAQPLGFMAEAADYCAGGELSSPDGEKCCPTSSWNNATYAAVKGAVALRYWNEKRVRTAGGIVAAPRADFPSGVEAYAWDHGNGDSAPITSGLVKQAQDAFALFWAIYPPERWVKVAQGVPSDCQSDGYYSQWRIKPPMQADGKKLWPKERVDALSKVTTYKFTSNDRIHLMAKGMAGRTWPAEVTSWLAKADAIIASVPGGAASQGSQTMPKEDALLKMSFVVPVSGAVSKVSPTDWLRGFISHFKQRYTFVAPPAAPKTAEATVTAPRDPSIFKLGLKPGGGPPAPSGPPALVVVGGAVVAAGAAYFLLRRYGVGRG
jgi:hypothetical protein